MNLKYIKTSQTLGQALRAIAQHHPHREALVFGDQRVTYAQLRERVEALSAGFHSLGIGRGDKVGLILPNCLEFVYTAYSLADIGAAAVPMSVQSGIREVEHILGDAEAVAVVTNAKAPGTDLLALIEELRPALPHLQHVIVRGQDVREPQSNEERSGAIAFDALLQTSPDTADPASTAEPSDAAMILYTSGTTGVPKGAVHSHRTLILAIHLVVSKLLELLKPSWDLIKVLPGHIKTIRRLPWLVQSFLAMIDRSQSRLLVMTPFYHVAGYFQILMGMLTGDKLVVMERFHPEKALELIQKERVTIVFGVPPMFRAMLNRPNFERYDLSSVVISGAGAMQVPPQLVREMKERIGGFVIIVYGATEMAGGMMTLPTDPADKQAETVGRTDSMSKMEVKIVDEEGRELPPGQVGEIAVRTPTLMEGYYKRPEATARAIDEEGWYYSGDLGMIDEDGYVWVKGRRGDLIIRAGANIYPAEIEHFLLTHPQIEQVAVIGVPGPADSGEKVRAYVVTKEGASLESGDVIGYCWGQIAAYKVPGEVVFVEELPVTSALQKVQHYKLRQQALREAGATQSQ